MGGANDIRRVGQNSLLISAYSSKTAFNPSALPGIITFPIY